ncbi:MAG: type VI secretion system baseplate subunit TssG [Tunicatimonas sp.]
MRKRNDPATTNAPALRNLTLERFVNELLATTDADVWPVLVCPQGSFSRSYRDDIVAVMPPVGSSEALRVNVAREGLYDMLPEGVFHDTRPRGAGIDTEAAVQEVEQNQREEREARHFFLPLEQEFYRQKIAIEHQEHAFHQPARPSSEAGGLLRKLWQIPTDLPTAQQQGFLYLAPHLHRLAGRLPDVQRCLSLLLPVPVRLTTAYPTSPVAVDGDVTALGEATLGLDAVLGDTLDDPWPYWQLTLGPVPGKLLLQFLEGGALHRFISWLAGYLLPAGVDYHTDIEVAAEDQAFCLEEDTSFMGRLGHTTYLI